MRHGACQFARRAATLALAAALAGLPLAADTVTLSDGTRIDGRVLIETPERVILETSGGRRSIDRAAIAGIERSPVEIGPPRPAEIKLGASYWPPRLNERFPELTLIDHRGRLVRLSSLRGKVVLVQLVDMACPASLALCGAHRAGPFGGRQPAANQEALADLFFNYTEGFRLEDERVALVQIVLRDADRKFPSPDAVRAWAEHFRLQERSNAYVLAGTSDLTVRPAGAGAPGFYLLDKTLVLRADATGERPRHPLTTALLPQVPKLLAER